MPANRKSNEQSNIITLEQIERLIERKFKEHESNITKIIVANTKLVNDKLDEFNKKLEDFKTSLEFSEKELEEKIENLNKKQEEINEEIFEKLRTMEDRSRRNNIRVDGVPESENETWDNSLEKVQQIIKNRLAIKDNIVIERARRGGAVKRNGGDQPRTIFAKILNFQDKNKILKKASRLKGSGIYISEDFSSQTMQIRKSLWPKVKELREQGKYAIIKYDRIVSHSFKK